MGLRFGYATANGGVGTGQQDGSFSCGRGQWRHAWAAASWRG